MTITDTTTTPAELAELKPTMQNTVRTWEPRLVELSHRIHETPEVAFTEHTAAALVAAALKEAGFATKVGAFGLDTAVEATYGTGDFVVAVCSEYDALPVIGHGCGHNLIAAAGVGAAVALASIADRAGITVKLLGTPAEESGGGKAVMLEAGAWEGATISLMVHGTPGIDVRCEEALSQAVDRMEIVYTGRPAHAAASPTAGINALDAATVALTAIGLLRQQLPGTVRVASRIAAGGDVTNIIPAHTVVEVEVRSFDVDELRDAKRRVLACFEAGAIASGCTWQWRRTQPRYANLRQEPFLASTWNDAVTELGRTVVSLGTVMGGSTDMGNVSQVVPAIHSGIGIEGVNAPPHTDEFCAGAITPAADRAVIEAATALAWTAATAAVTPEVRAELLQRQDARPTGGTMVSQDED